MVMVIDLITNVRVSRRYRSDRIVGRELYIVADLQCIVVAFRLRFDLITTLKILNAHIS